MAVRTTNYIPRVAVVIPVCNEQEALPVLKIRLAELQRGLQKRFILFYLFVDDGSTDHTVERLQHVVPAGAGFQVISHGKNMGLGEAFRSGFQATGTAEIVCTIDADCSYRADLLIPMIEAIAEGTTDVVVASPYHPQGSVDGVPPWRLAISRRCSWLYRMVSPLKLDTYTSMFRAYRGSVARSVRFPSSGFVSTVEILLSAASMGYRVAELPVTLHRRVAGTSKMRIAKTIHQHLNLIFACINSTDKGFPAFCYEDKSRPGPSKEAVDQVMKMAGSSR